MQRRSRLWRGLKCCNWGKKVVEDLRITNEDLKVPRYFYVYYLHVKGKSQLFNNQKIKYNEV